jgi:hypothetical protein
MKDLIFFAIGILILIFHSSIAHLLHIRSTTVLIVAGIILIIGKIRAGYEGP